MKKGALLLLLRCFHKIVFEYTLFYESASDVSPSKPKRQAYQP